MSKNKLIFWSALLCFVGLTTYALWNEITRNTAKLEHSISGVILTAPGVGGGIVKTDNAHILLFDPVTLELVASRILNPFLPPVTFSISQSDTDRKLSGMYRMLVLTDKDGNPYRHSVGEIIGPLTQQIPLGTEGFKYYLDRPFKSFPEELMYRETDAPESSISVIVKATPKTFTPVCSSHPHNYQIQVLHNSGLVGFVLISIFVFLFLLKVFKRLVNKNYRSHAMYLIPIVLTYFIGPIGLVVYWFFRIFFSKKIDLYE